MKPILIHKGDDTIFAHCLKFLTFNLETKLDLTGWKAKFVLGWVTKEINDISSKQFEVILSSEDTKKLRLGLQYGQIILTDSRGNIKTITNSIPFEVVTTVIETVYQEVDLTIPESAEIDVKMKIGTEFVTSVNGMTGIVELDIPSIEGLATEEQVQQGLDTKQDKGDYALRPEIPTNNSQLENGAGYITASYHDSTKQDVISDLETIREGASKGETALQSVPDEYVTETELNAKGYITSSSIPTKTSQLTNDSDFINTQYIVSRGENLVTNGTGILQNNYNFSLFTFDPTDGVESSGSFKLVTSGSAKVYTDEYMPYDSSQSYKLSYYVKNSSTTETYDFLICYDMDKQPIMEYQCRYRPNGLMELARPLKRGDTVVYVDDVSKIDITKGEDYANGFIFWNYTSKSGFDYGVETYSRWSYLSIYKYANIDTANNTVTLNNPWNGPEFEAGHKLSQVSAGLSYSYSNPKYFPEPGKWTLKTYTFTKSKIFTGTSYIQAAWLVNYSRIANNEFKLSTVTLSAKQDNLLSIQGYDATKTQTLKHVKGVLQWVDG